MTLDEAVWDRAADLARATRSRGITVPCSDLLVAACALSHGVELDHCDSHFDLVMPATP